MTQSFEQILKFVDLLHQYRAVERRVLKKDSKQSENDVEHSYSLAMLAWYVNSKYDLNLDSDKLFKYALAHDMVEIYAGDTFFYQTDKDKLDDKHKREEEAAKRLQKEFPEFTELHESIASYEERVDKESKFIYALDKVEPVLSIYRDKGRTWRKDHVTLDMLKTMKLKKVALDGTVESIFTELTERLESEHDELFD